MKIFISSDMEGTAGVVDWEQVRPTGPQYDYYVGLLLDEVNAAIEGAREAGADEFVVNDSHGKMANLLPSKLAGRARYVSGRYKPRYMMQGLDETFDAVFFVSYHGSMSARAATLSHTYFPAAFAEVSLNGRVVGEAGINALVAKAYDVPIVLVTGDATTATEIEPLCPGIRSAVVKESITRFAADSLHPDTACELIRRAASEAVRDLARIRPPEIECPARLEMRFHNADYAELACRIAGVERTGDLAAEVRGEPLEAFMSFVTVVLMCRGLVE